jgi:putative two-component system response regulator
MIGVPDAIVAKVDELTAEEAAIVARHTVMGESILSPMRTFRPFVASVRWHHERFDGRGYPDGLSGSQIPLEAQIVAVANRFDEIRHDGKMPGQREALEILKAEGLDGAFDAPLVEALRSALEEEPMRMPAKPASLRRGTSRPRILAVDDSKMNRDLISATLSEVGFDVEHAENGSEAMMRLEQGGIDLMLLDLLMPIQDGNDTLVMIREDARYEFIPVIVLTAQKSSELRQKAILAGADDFLSFPLNRLELITRIRSLLRIAEYHNDLETSQNVICALALALEAKDTYTRGHSQRVGDLASNFATHVGLSSEASERIRIAGLLHDIGKIAVPEQLLNKSGPLTREEFLRVIDHPVIGEEICRPLQTLHSVLKMIRHHHERFDGRGYPDGLLGDAIPYEVRILSIADAYDALTSHRAYRPKPLTHQAAVETLEREAEAGKWDPILVRAFKQMLGDSSPDFAAIARPVPSLQLGM